MISFFTNKKKFLIILVYIILILIFYKFFFDFQFDKKKIINFFLENKKIIDSFIKDYPIKLNILFFLITVVWTIFLGFGLPTMMLSAYLFNPIYATLILVISKTVGVSFIYLFFNKFFIKNLMDSTFLNKINKKKLSNLFKKDELYYLILLRLFPGVPVQIADVLPLFLKVKFRNYILSKFFGSLVPHFLLINFFNELYKNIDKNFTSNLKFSITSELFIAFFIFFLFIVLSNFIKKRLKLTK